jgi:RNA polymerase sigma-70 factor (ECF subfamily)
MDADTLNAVYAAHAAALTLYARQWCRAADDVVQEAFVALALRSRLPDPIRPWLYRVVRNRAVSQARAEQRRSKHEAHAAQATWFVHDPGWGVDAATATAALGALPVEQREVIVAQMWGELTFAEIGVLVGCSAATACRRFAAGVTALRQRLGVTCSPT